MREATPPRFRTLEPDSPPPTRGGDPDTAAHATTANRTRDTVELARLGAVFASTVSCYLTSVLPRVTRELSHWQRRAAAIPDPDLRCLALDALSKRGNMEGAALFAVLAPRRHRHETVRALVAFQTAYNYLDTLAEQPSPDPVGNASQLHQALLAALDHAPSHPDFYALNPRAHDGGFLAELLDTCNSALATLPSRRHAANAASLATGKIVQFQSLNLTDDQGGHGLLQYWATLQTPAGSGLEWWQTAAGAGSSLAVHALIAAAADPATDAASTAAIQDAYFPWICALHSLLDSLIDVQEDRRAGQRNLLGYHDSGADALAGMRSLAARAVEAARGLPDPRHRVILTAMTAYYLSSPEADDGDARAIAAAVAGASGPLLEAALLLFWARRFAAQLTHGAYR